MDRYKATASTVYFYRNADGDWVRYSDVAPLVEALREIKMVTGNEYVDHLDGNHQAYKLASAALSTLDADGSKP